MKNITSYNRKRLFIITGILLVSVVLVLTFTSSETETEEATHGNVRSVNILNISDFSSGAIGVAVPTANGNSFVIRAESAGLVEKSITAGEKVEQGQVLATIENQSQLAALTQAEGNYEAAVASAEQSGFNVDSSQENLTTSYNSANTVLRSAAISVQGIMENTIQTYFRDGLRQNLQLTDFFWEKKMLDYDVENWNELTKATVPDSQLLSELEKQIVVAQRLADLLDVIYGQVLNGEKGASDSELAVLAGYKSDLTTVKSSIASTLQTLKKTKLQLTDAQASLARAQSSSLGGNTSAEEARIKQALGALQSARANYQKTLVKAPFAGTLSSVNVSVGDIINIGTDVAIIVPEAGVETSKSFSLPLTTVKYTPDNAYVFTVSAENTLEPIRVETGLVTAQSITVTGLNGDEIIVADVRGLKAGDAVNVSSLDN